MANLITVDMGGASDARLKNGFSDTDDTVLFGYGSSSFSGVGWTGNDLLTSGNPGLPAPNNVGGLYKFSAFTESVLAKENHPGGNKITFYKGNLYVHATSGTPGEIDRFNGIDVASGVVETVDISGVITGVLKGIAFDQNGNLYVQSYTGTDYRVYKFVKFSNSLDSSFIKTMGFLSYTAGLTIWPDNDPILYRREFSGSAISRVVKHQGMTNVIGSFFSPRNEPVDLAHDEEGGVIGYSQGYVIG